MLKKSTKSLFAAFALIAGATLAAPASAEWRSGGGVYIGGGDAGIYFGSGHGHWRKGHIHGRHYKKRHYHRGRCGPRKALNKAWNMGVNRPHVARINNKRIVVVGYNYGHSAKVVFKRNSHKCRVIKTRGLY